MTDLAKPVSRSWRRFLRFSLRGLIVLVLVIGVWLGCIVRKAREQHDAVAAVQKAGGRVYYDWEFKNGLYIRNASPPWPRWLVDRIGVDLCGHVVRSAMFKSIVEAELSQIGRLNRLEGLSLYQTCVADSDLPHLRRLKDLKELHLGNNRITDAGLANLNGLTTLRVLYLGGNDVTDAGLARLKRLTDLKDLSLSYTKVTDAGLVHLKGMIQLSRLDLTGTSVTDAGMNALSRALPRLTIIR